jgi:hypothetical protein
MEGIREGGFDGKADGIDDGANEGILVVGVAASTLKFSFA